MALDDDILNKLRTHPEGLTFNGILKELRRQKPKIQNPQLSRALKRLMREQQIERVRRLASSKLTWRYRKPNPNGRRIESYEIEKVAEGLSHQEAEEIVEWSGLSLELFIRALTMSSISPRLLESVLTDLKREPYWPEVEDIVHAMLGRFGCE